MKSSRQLEADSDAACRREGAEEQDGGYTGRAIKDAIFASRGVLPNSQPAVHLLDCLQGQLKQVCRAKITSEALACINTVDSMLALSILMYHMAIGAVKNQQAVRMTEGEGNLFERGVNVESMSIISALDHVNMKEPSENSFLAHSTWLQDRIIIRAISWLQSLDTRGMYADGLTIGSVPRGRLPEVPAA